MGIRAYAWSGAAAVFLMVFGCNADPKGMPTRDHDPTMPDAPYVPSGTPPPPPAAGSGAPSTSPPGTMDAGKAPPSGNTMMDAGSAPGDDPNADAAADAGPILPTVCADDDAGVGDEDAGARDCIVVGDVKVQYRAADTNASDNQIKPHFNLVNSGKKAVDLSELTIRYWFADESAANLVFWCDYAQIGCGSVHGAFTTSDRIGGNHVLEVTFTSGTLAAGAATGEIQARFNHEDWALFDETDDYSFDPSKTAFADWYKVTLYQRGTLIWGAEPL